MFDLSTVSGIAAAMFSLFTYTTDLEQFGVYDDQRSYAQTVKLGKPFKDDCDGFALTAVDLLKEAGIWAWPIVVQASRINDYRVHMIAAFIDPATNEVMALDNNYIGVRSLQATMGGSMYRLASMPKLGM